MTSTDQLLNRLDAMLTRAEKLFGGPVEAPDWNTTLAARWRSQGSARYFQAIKKPHRIQLSDLQGVDEQKNDLVRNTEQFLAGLPANNALLWGSRGTGKSSLGKYITAKPLKKRFHYPNGSACGFLFIRTGKMTTWPSSTIG